MCHEQPPCQALTDNYDLLHCRVCGKETLWDKTKALTETTPPICCGLRMDPDSEREERRKLELLREKLPLIDEVKHGICSLSPREIEVLRLSALGLFPSEIASALGVCESTVYSHQEHFAKKLETHRPVDWARIALRGGLLAYSEWLFHPCTEQEVA